MAYDNTSVTGDEICDYYYDIENNFMNPPSPTGYFIYKVLGGCFDRIAELVNQFRIDYSILDCDVGKVEIGKLPDEPNITHTYYEPSYSVEGNEYIKHSHINGEWVDETINSKILNSLDNFWGKSYNLLRPSISFVEDGETYSRYLTDEEYKIYLYLRNHQLLTRKDLLVAFGNSFGDVAFETETLGVAHTVTHKKYDNPSFSNDTLMSYDPEDTDIVVRTSLAEEENNTVIDKKTDSSILVVTIQGGDWDPVFLTFLEGYSSIKGNVKIMMG